MDLILSKQTHLTQLTLAWKIEGMKVQDQSVVVDRSGNVVPVAITNRRQRFAITSCIYSLFSL